MTRTAQPCNLIQLPFLVPTTLNYFRVHLPWYKVVVGKRYMLPLADLAAVRPCSGQGWGVLRGWLRGGADIGVHAGLEEAV